jgi:hypothetical protein
VLLQAELRACGVVNRVVMISSQVRAGLIALDPQLLDPGGIAWITQLAQSDRLAGPLR